MKKLLNNKFFRVVFVYFIPIIIGGLFSALGTWGYNNDKYFFLKLVLVIILTIFYCYTSYQYDKKEKDLNNQLYLLNNEMKK